MGHRPLVLIVEDDRDIAELLVVLTQGEGFHAQHTATLAAALATDRSQPPDVILLDIGLPDAQGTEGLERLARIHPNVPIIMLTANADERLARETLRRGAFDYVTKPFDADHVGRVLEAAVGGVGLEAAGQKRGSSKI